VKKHFAKDKKRRTGRRDAFRLLSGTAKKEKPGENVSGFLV
jgi:hypothetical protein